MLDKIDEHIPEPKRDLEKPFLLPIEDTCSISGRGTVITGRVERGILKKGDEVEFIGRQSNLKSIITGRLCIFPFCYLSAYLLYYTFQLQISK